MNRKLIKSITLVFAVVLIFALVIAFVACDGNGNSNNNNNNNSNNNNNDNNNDYWDGEVSPEMQALADDIKNDIELFCGYMIDHFETDNYNSVDVESFDRYDHFADTSVDISYHEWDPKIQDYIECLDINFYSEEEASQYYEENFADDPDYQLVGKKIIENKALYDKIISENAKPHVKEKFDQQALDFLNKNIYVLTPEKAMKIFSVGFDRDMNAWRLRGYIDNAYLEVEFGLIGVEEFEYEFDDAQECLESKYCYTGDSYIKRYEEKGLVEYSLKDRPGWHIDEIDGGKYSINYWWDGKPIKELTVPSKIGNYNIDTAYIWMNEGQQCIIDTLKVEEGINYLGIGAVDVKTISLPYIEEFEMLDNGTLETINFAGTEAEFLEMADPTEWIDAEHFDESGNLLEVSLTFTVNFADGTSKTYGGNS